MSSGGWRAASIGERSVSSVKVTREKPDMCEAGRYVIEPVFPPGPASPTVTPGGSPGRYKAKLVFAVPGKQIYREEVTVDSLLAGGASLVSVGHPDVAKIRVDTQWTEGNHTIWFHLNEERTIGRAEIELEAQSLSDAEKQSYYIVSRILSTWAVLYHVGIDITLRYAEELRTGQMSVIVGLVGKTQQLDARVGQLQQVSAEWTRLFSTYREALSATNDFYRCLCLFKVADGIIKLRAKRSREAGQRGERPSEPSESIPANWTDVGAPDWERESFAPYLGWKFTRVVDQGLRQQVRNTLAHLDPTQDSDLYADDPEHLTRAEAANHVLRYMCKRMLDNEIGVSY